MRKLCWFAVPCSAAVFLAVRILPKGLLLPAGLFCALTALLSLRFKGSARRKTALAAVGLAIGFLWTGAYTILFLTPAHSLTGERAEHRFVVTDYPAESRRGAVLSTRLLTADKPGAEVVLYADADALDLLPGDVISAEAKLAPSDFLKGEQVDYYQSKGIYLLGYADETVLVSRPDGIPPRYWPQVVSHAMKGAFLDLFPEDVSGFFIALTTGDKSQLPVGLYSAFRRAGLAHVVAVSGLHIGFLSGLLTLLLGKHRKRTFVVVLPLLFFFAAVAGNSPSALRAVLMQVILLLAPLLLREEDKPTTLSAVLLLLLLPCPYAVTSVSLQLSFAAVAGIYLVTGPLYARWRRGLPKGKKWHLKLARKVLAFCLGTLATTLGALLFTTPLAAWYFRSVSLAGPLTNLLVLWAVSDAFLLGLAAALLGIFLPGPGRLLAELAAWPARWAILISKAIAKLPFATVSLTSIYLVGWFLLTYGIVLLFLFRRKRGGMRPAIPIAVCVLTLCSALVMNAWPAITGTLMVTALDVGQGASTLFCSRGHTVLVDCGGNSGDDPGDIAADAVQALGTSRLDALVLTHFHADHAGGVPELLTRLDVGVILAPDVDRDNPLRQEILSLAEANNCEVVFLADDAHITFGDAGMTLFEPMGAGDANEEGLSALCSVGGFDILLTGDMTDSIERRLVKYKSLPDIEILMVGHHGSRHAASEELLLATTPERAVISCGYNSYGHPAPETLERLGAAGCGIYRTDLMGSITFTLGKQGME